ncbi:MAG: hypothetical protein KC729_16615, partial [Candidatus Eisenbacteria bacterium]|nr:hypothetical protein [Candidatus Eisenbacteria bacterium]
MTRYGSTATTRTALRALIRSIRTPVSLQRTVALLGQVAVFLTVPVWGMDARSQEIEWELLRPTNSGIPGEIVENVVWAPDGKLWVAAEQPQWQEGGVGILDLQTEIWTGFSNWQSPLPSHFVGDIKFDAQGVAWIGSS